MKPASSNLSPEDFIKHPEVLQCLKKLEAKFTVENQLFVSDVLDEEGHQYVHLVQKGGGVLGVALVGYTFILEQMGIRFLRLAGTSAGAINTALMTVIGNKQEPKSEKIIEILSGLHFFDLVDGPPVIRYLIRKLVSRKSFTAGIKRWGVVLTFLGVLLFFVNFILLGFIQSYPFLTRYAFGSFIVSAVYFIFLGSIIWYIVRILKRLKNSGFGLNPGNYFYDWIKKQLAENGVHTVDDLNHKASSLPYLTLRPENPGDPSTLFGDVTFITSDLVTQNKVQLPEMSYLFRRKEDINTLSPAGFIRASMAIPVFFESYYIKDIPCTDPEIQEAWSRTFNEKDPPETVRFVDGGILSNFPINIFYNPKITIPRLPSFGIDLDDSAPEDQKKNAEKWTFAGYIGRMFNTIRFYYDKDFLLKNKLYGKGIGTVPLSEYNWLNFFLTNQDKIEMFVKGAKAATEFLLQFDWQGYKLTRETMKMQLDIEEGKADLKPLEGTGYSLKL